MRIDVLAVGSRGDVQPCIALGAGLERAGHQVRLVTLRGFEAPIRERGLDHLTIGDDHQNIARSEEGTQWAEERGNAAGFARGFIRIAASLIENGIATYWRAGDHPAAIVSTVMGLPVGGHIAERLEVPIVRVSFAPTRLDWAGRDNRMSALKADVGTAIAGVFRQAVWMGLRSVTNKARHEILDLPPLPWREPYSIMNKMRIPVLDAYSPSVVPGLPACDSWIHVTGYWFLDDTPEWTPSSEMVDFLAAGAPPVFVGFGSTPFPNPDAATALVVAALEKAGKRGFVVAGGSGLGTGRLTDDVLSVTSVPHGWLFPRVSGAVHHGGAGVTGAALRAGLPSVIVPIFGDQPFWAQRIFDLGAAAAPIPAKRLSVEALSAGLQSIAAPEVRKRAVDLGQQIRGEAGVPRAIEAIERHLEAFAAGHNAALRRH